MTEHHPTHRGPHVVTSFERVLLTLAVLGVLAVVLVGVFA